jgi:protein-tyrosine phosphatase
MNLDGGIHSIPVPDASGQMWLCGKHAIGPDPQEILDRVGVDHVVCLVERFEIHERYPAYADWLETSGRATWFPIADLDFGKVDDVAELVDSVVEMLRVGQSLIVHCGAGIGRAGTLAVAVCLRSGMDLDTALEHVRLHRPGAGPEVGSQTDFVREWSRVVAGRTL